MERNSYENPLTSRYASREMSYIWSPRNKFSTWRRLWLALAKAEKELGLTISDEQLAELEEHLDEIDFAAAETKEKELRHDVMSHVHVYGEQCPKARPIIHLGATSCYVTDNTELLQIRASLELIRKSLIGVIAQLRQFSECYKELPTLGFTHFQPAQLTTVGKRASLWLYDLVIDCREIEKLLSELPFRGVKGTTGTQASFLSLFDGNHEKVKALDNRVAEIMGFENRIPVSGQTYSRKWDYRVLATLSGIAQSLNKMAADIRLLAHMKEVEEPFGSSQVGSSAMAYKRNPMRCERICALARYVISMADNGAQTHANQWFERTLDDSANRRLSLPQAFLGTDVLLALAENISAGIQVWPAVIKKHVKAELPFMATEHIIMAGVKAGGDRQELHEAIRKHSMNAARRVKEDGVENDLMARLKEDPLFAAVASDFDELIDPVKFIGRAPEQVDEFLHDTVDPLLQRTANEVNEDTQNPERVQV